MSEDSDHLQSRVEQITRKLEIALVFTEDIAAILMTRPDLRQALLASSDDKAVFLAILRWVDELRLQRVADGIFGDLAIRAEVAIDTATFNPPHDETDEVN